MKKTVSVQRTLLLSITLTGDMTRDLIALESYGFENIPIMYIQKRDMVAMSHEPMVFYNGPKGTYSHSLGEDNVLSIWQETITVEDCYIMVNKRIKITKCKSKLHLIKAIYEVTKKPLKECKNIVDLMASQCWEETTGNYQSSITPEQWEEITRNQYFIQSATEFEYV